MVFSIDELVRVEKTELKDFKAVLKYISNVPKDTSIGVWLLRLSQGE